MRPNQKYVNGIITNHWNKPHKSQKSEIITFIVELTTIALLLGVITLLAIFLQ